MRFLDCTRDTGGRNRRLQRPAEILLNERLLARIPSHQVMSLALRHSAPRRRSSSPWQEPSLPLSLLPIATCSLLGLLQLVFRLDDPCRAIPGELALPTCSLRHSLRSLIWRGAFARDVVRANVPSRDWQGPRMPIQPIHRQPWLLLMPGAIAGTPQWVVGWSVFCGWILGVWVLGI